MSIYFVSPSGSDKYVGSQSQPYKTLRRGLTTLRPGDTLYVRQGEYAERLGGNTPIAIRPGTPTAPIRVLAYEGEHPVLRGLLWLNRPSYWHIQGLNVHWRDDGLKTEHMVKVTNGIGWQISQSELWGAKSFAALLIYSSRVGEPHGWSVRECHIHHTEKTNGINQDHLIYVNSGLHDNRGVISHCLLHDAPNGNAVKLMGSDELQGVCGVVVDHCTVDQVSQAFLVGGTSRENEIIRCIAQRMAGTNPIARPYRLTGGGNILRENLWWMAKSLQWSEGNERRMEELGNVFFDPVLDENYRPQNVEAVGYGALAPAAF